MLNIRVRSHRGDRQQNRGIGSSRKQQPFKYRKIVPKAIRPLYSGHPLELQCILKRIFKPPVALKVLIYEHNDYKLCTLYDIHHNIIYVLCTPDIVIDYSTHIIYEWQLVVFQTKNNLSNIHQTLGVPPTYIILYSWKKNVWLYYQYIH